MVSAIVKVDFEDLTDAVPAYLCLIAMPLMYSIAAVSYTHLSGDLTDGQK